tara:strand:- start:95 stop:547 length:453 start_codon:yes stop_codon:yes gene_type:complete
MATIKSSELSETIIKGVSKNIAKLILPRIRKMVKEEIDRGMKEVMLEVIKANNNIIGETVSSPNITAAKNVVAQRQQSKDRARQIIEKSGLGDDPLMKMVADAEDPADIEEEKQQQLMETPMVNSGDLQKGDVVMPEQINFEKHLNKMGM